MASSTATWLRLVQWNIFGGTWHQLECSWAECLAFEWHIFRCLGYTGKNLFVKILDEKCIFKIQNWLWGLGTEIAFSSFKADPAPSWNNTVAIQRVKQYFTFEEGVLVNTNTNYLRRGWQVAKSTDFETQQNKNKNPRCFLCQLWSLTFTAAQILIQWLLWSHHVFG